ncbi:Uncharacterised protein [Mycobacterium tuberculosis]|nr:Uncharacterised protein [Mycobacterium tuberculosis]
MDIQSALDIIIWRTGAILLVLGSKVFGMRRVFVGNKTPAVQGYLYVLNIDVD